MNDASQTNQSNSRGGSFGVFTEGGQRYMRTPIGVYPLGAWWVLVATLVLLPLLPFALLFLLFGWIIALRFRQQPRPMDARAFAWIGRTLFKIIWLPQTIYFSLVRPDEFKRWRSSTVNMGAQAARKAEAKAREVGAKVIFGDDGARIDSRTLEGLQPGEEVKDAEQ